MSEPERFMSYGEFAQYIGVTTGSLSRYKLPEPDVYIGTTRGWREETVKTWHENRPSQKRLRQQSDTNE